MIAMSSADLRFSFAMVGGASITRTDSAWAPFLPSAIPNSSFEPGLTVTPAGSADACRKTSWPSSELMNPKPFSSS